MGDKTIGANYSDPAVDDGDLEDEAVPSKYTIISYGADYDVDGLIRRQDRGDIFIPPFQRNFAWSPAQASRFVESLLLGLPIPGIFLAIVDESQKMLVIDGQQRLKTLRFFGEGVFAEGVAKGNVFALTNVHKDYEGKTFDKLDPDDQRRFRDTIIHATIVKQAEPDDANSSIYQVFERINTGGERLHPQEIRACIFHGELMEFLQELNRTESWRAVYGPESARMKDRELILRFLALAMHEDAYRSPMKEFLNKFAKRYRKPDAEFRRNSAELFTLTIGELQRACERQAFRPDRALNAAAFDAIMVGLARRLAAAPPPASSVIRRAYDALLLDGDFKEAIRKATANEQTVATRIRLATKAFSSI